MEIIVCDIRNDEGLRFRKDKDILPCITEHIHKDGGGQYSCLIMEYEVCDFRFDEGIRTRIEKDIMPTIPARDPKSVSGVPYTIERERERVKWKMFGFGN